MIYVRNVCKFSKKKNTKIPRDILLDTYILDILTRKKV